MVIIRMSAFKSRLSRFDNFKLQPNMPIPRIAPNSISNTIPISFYSLQGVISPSIFDLPVSNYPTSTVPPVGSMLTNISGSLPVGYLECNGSEVSRITYDALFNAIGTYYGEGNTTTTFNLPHLYNVYNPNVQYIIKY
jgi:hypothetical protein